MILTIHNGPNRLTWIPVQGFLKQTRTGNYRLVITNTNYVDPIPVDVTLTLYMIQITDNFYYHPETLVDPNTGILDISGFTVLGDNKGNYATNEGGDRLITYSIDVDGFPSWEYYQGWHFDSETPAFSQLFFVAIDSNSGNKTTNLLRHDWPIGDP